jgi:hypothetical protein
MKLSLKPGMRWMCASMAWLLKVGRSSGVGKMLECGTTAAGTEGAAAA